MAGRAHRGATLVEALVAAFILGLLTTAVFALYQMGLNAFFKTNTQSDILQTVQVLGGKWMRDAELTTPEAVSLDLGSTAIALPSARDAAGNLVLDTVNSELIWQRYRLYWHDAPSQTVRFKEIVLATPTSAIGPIETYDDGSGTHPLSWYCTGGRVIARQVSLLQLTRNGASLSLEVQARQDRYGSPEPEQLQHRFVVVARN